MNQDLPFILCRVTVESTVATDGTVGHFRVFLCLLFQSESKCETFHMKMSSACSFIFMQIKVIFIRMVSHWDSFWNRGKRELRNSLLSGCEDDFSRLVWPSCKYLLLTEFDFRTVSYGPSFFPLTLKKPQKTGSVTYGTDREHEVS